MRLVNITESNGTGVFFFPNGDVYAGGMITGDKESLGIFYRKKPIPLLQKKIEMGMWKNDRLVEKFDDLRSTHKKTLREIEQRLESFTGSDQWIQKGLLHYGEGTGVWVSKDGHILTPTRNICWGKITIDGQKTKKAKWLDDDKDLGLSLIKVGRSSKHFVSFDLELPEVGDQVSVNGLDSKSVGKVRAVGDEEIFTDSELSERACRNQEGVVLTNESGKFLSIGVATRNFVERIFNQTKDFSRIDFPSTARIYEFLKKNGVSTSNDGGISSIEDCLVQVRSNFGFD